MFATLSIGPTMGAYHRAYHGGLPLGPTMGAYADQKNFTTEYYNLKVVIQFFMINYMVSTPQMRARVKFAG